MTAEILTYSKPMDDLPVEYASTNENAGIVNEKLNPDAVALNWALNAESLQQDLYLKLGNRIFDEYFVAEAEYLEVKIAYAKFGPPNITENGNKQSITYEEFQKIHHYADEKSNIIHAYSSLYSIEQRKKAKETVDLILKLLKKQTPGAEKFHVAFIFIVYQLGETDLCGLIPIIRVLRKEGDPEDDSWFIDQENRVYMNWTDYLDDNRLPKLRICYPKNGYYSVNEQGYSIFMPESRVVVKFGMTPAHKFTHKLLRGLDWTSSGVLIGSLGIAVAAALSAPISAPILTGAAVGSSIAAVYGASRSGATLVDRKLHEQTINVKNSEARSCWIGIGGAVFALSASSATLLLERAVELGQTVGTSALYTVNGLNIGALGFNAAGVANQAHYLGERLVKGQGITAFEVLEFTLSTFLFTNALVSFQTANAQIMENHGEIKGIGQSTAADSAAKKPGIIDKFAKHFEAENLFDRNSRVIRTLNSIENPNQFFTKSVELTKQLNKVVIKIDRTKKAKYTINGAEIHSNMAESQTDKNHLQLPTVNNFPRTFSEPAIDKLKENQSKENLFPYRSKVEEVLSNDYKFLVLIGVAKNGIDDLRKLENQIQKKFEGLDKEFSPELLKICIALAKELSIDSVIEFLNLCAIMKKSFTSNTKPLFKKFSKDVAQEILNQLKADESPLRLNLIKELKEETFKNLNNNNKYKFESAASALRSYETYVNNSKLADFVPLNPKEFMAKINWLFSIEPQDKNLVSYKGRSQYRKFHTSNGWRGVLYEDEKNSKDRVVTEFEFKKEASSIGDKKGFFDKVGSLFQ